MRFPRSSRTRPREKSRRKCTVIAAIPAAHCEQATSAARRAFPAGVIACATMAVSCSSICVMIPGSPQVVADPDSPAFRVAETLRAEWVVRVDGKVRARPAGTENAELPTGAVEVYIREIEVLGRAAELPLPVFGDQEYPEEIRLPFHSSTCVASTCIKIS